MAETVQAPGPIAAGQSAGPPALQVRGLYKSFGGQVVLNGVDVDLRHGEVVLLRGANGSGKTTFLNVLTGNLEPDAGHIRVGANGCALMFDFTRQWWRRPRLKEKFSPEWLARVGVNRTWQETRLFNSLDLADNVAVSRPGQTGEIPLAVFTKAFRVRRELKDDRIAAASLLERFGLVGRAGSSADKISLGQAKRVAIARSINARSRVLFLDEPLAGLDGSGVDGVLRFLDELAREHAVTMVIVEHVFNIPRVLGLATTVWTLADGKLTVEEPGAVGAELATHETVDDSDEVQSWLSMLAPSPSAVSHHELTSGARLTVAARRQAGSAAPVLEVDDLVVHRGRRPVVGRERGDGECEGLSFALNDGDVAILQAPNGWGKTTLFEALAGTIPIQRGRVRIGGRDVTRDPTWTRVKNGLALLQSRANSFPNLTVRECLYLAGTDPRRENLEHLADRSVGDLSGGQKQSVALACALADSSCVVRILDEPFGMLDYAAIENGKDRISRQKGATLFLIPSTHND